MIAYHTEIGCIHSLPKIKIFLVREFINGTHPSLASLYIAPVPSSTCGSQCQYLIIFIVQLEAHTPPNTQAHKSMRILNYIHSAIRSTHTHHQILRHTSL